MTSRPWRSESANRHHRRQARWLEIRLCDSASALTSSETVRGRSSSSSRIARRVGWPRTRKKRAVATSSAAASRAAVVVCTSEPYNRFSGCTLAQPPNGDRARARARAPCHPVLFGQRRRLFEDLAAEQIELQHTRILEREGVSLTCATKASAERAAPL